MLKRWTAVRGAPWNRIHPCPVEGLGVPKPCSVTCNSRKIGLQTGPQSLIGGRFKSRRIGTAPVILQWKPASSREGLGGP